MPVDVRNVDGEDGEGRVPTGTSVLIPVFLLNEDIGVADNNHGGPFLDRSVRRPRSGCCGGTLSSAMLAGARWPRSRYASTTAPKFMRVRAENSQLANFAFAIHFFAEYVVSIEYVSRNAYNNDVHAFTRRVF